MSISSLWLNLPVNDVSVSRRFFKAIGFKENPTFANSDDAASFLIGEHDFIVMLFPYNTFRGFIQDDIADPKNGKEVLINIDAQNKEEVDLMAEKVRAAGGKISAEPQEAEGWMYAFGFEDPDGHCWSMLYMDMSKSPLAK